MGDQTRVTVVIPAYKAEGTIRRAVDSVLAQEGVEARAIVVVDGVFDGTLERLRDYDPGRVSILVNERNRGVQVTRNRGLAACQDPFVLFLDCDDFVEGRLLAGLAERMAEEEAEIGFGPMQRLYEPSGARAPVVHRDYASPDDLFWQWIGLGRSLNPSTIMWRTEFLRSIGGWDERVFRNEDGEVVMRTVLRGGRFTLAREGCGIYVNYDSPKRLTRRPETLESALKVGEILASEPSSTVTDEGRRRALAAYFFRISLRLHALGRSDLARRASEHAKDMGLQPRLAHSAHHWIARLIGIPFSSGLLKLDQQGRTVGLLLGLAARNVTYASRPRWLRVGPSSAPGAAPPAVRAGEALLRESPVAPPPESNKGAPSHSGCGPSGETGGR